MTPTAPRLATVLLAAALVATACGGHSPSTSLAPIPALSAAGDRAPAAMGIAEPAYPYSGGRVEYRVQGTLPGLAAGAAAYRLSATTTEDRVVGLARALGLSGAVSSDASGWTVTGSGSALHVQRSGGLPWTLGQTAGGAIGSSGCAVAAPAPAIAPGGRPAPPGATITAPPPCPSPTPVPGLPSRADAERLARAGLSGAGLDLGGATVETSGGIGQWFVSVVPAVGGMPTSAPWSVTVGPHGALLSASGWLAAPESAGDYPLVGVPAGLDRLRQGATWVLRGGPGPMPLMGVASGAGNAASSAVPPALPVAPGAPVALPPSSVYPPLGGPCLQGGPCSAPGSPPLATPCAPGACPTMAPPPPVVETVTGVHLGLAWGTPAGSAAAGAWLVPVYIFELGGGATVPILAVSDRFISPPSSLIAP